MKDRYRIKYRIPNTYSSEHKQLTEQHIIRQLTDNLLADVFLPSMKPDESVKNTTKSDWFAMRLVRVEVKVEDEYWRFRPDTDTEIEYTIDVKVAAHQQGE